MATRPLTDEERGILTGKIVASREMICDLDENISNLKRCRKRFFDSLGLFEALLAHGEIEEPEQPEPTASNDTFLTLPKAKPPVPVSALCHGCGRTYNEHPNDSGCQVWHDGPE